MDFNFLDIDFSSPSDVKEVEKSPEDIEFLELLKDAVGIDLEPIEEKFCKDYNLNIKCLSKDLIKLFYNKLHKFRHDFAISCLIKCNENLQQLNDEEMDFFDFIDTDNNNKLELTFDYTVEKKLLKGMRDEQVILLSPIHCTVDQFKGYKIDDFHLLRINELNNIIKFVFDLAKNRYNIDLTKNKRYQVYHLPKFPQLKDEVNLNFDSSEFTNEEKRILSILKKEINIINKQKDFFRCKFLEVKDVDMEIIQKSFETAIKDHPAQKDKGSSLYFPNSSKSEIDFKHHEILSLLKDKDNFIEDIYKKLINNEDLFSTLHLDDAKIDFVKKKKTFTKMEKKISHTLNFNDTTENITKLLYYENYNMRNPTREPKLIPHISFTDKASSEFRNKITEISTKFENLTIADYLKLVEKISINVLHNNRKTKRNQLEIHQITKNYFVIYGHGTSKIDKKYSKPFCIFGIGDSNPLNNLFKLKYSVDIPGNQFAFFTQWFRMPISYLEHWSSSFERAMLSTVMNFSSSIVSDNTITESELVEEFCLKSLIILNNKKKLQLDLDNFKYLSMGMVSKKCDIIGLIETKYNNPIKDELSLYIRKQIKNNLNKISNYKFLFNKPKFRGSQRDSITRGCKLIGEGVIINRKLTNFQNFLDNCYLSHLTSKDAASSYHDKYQSLKGIIEWENLYNESNVMDESDEKLIRLIKRPEKMNFHPKIVRICGKLLAQKLKNTNCSKELSELRMDDPISIISNTNSMVYERYVSKMTTNGFDVKNFPSELRKKVHDVVMETMSSGKLNIEDIISISDGYIPYFNMANKVQFGGPREIYIQDLQTRLCNWWIELNFSIICSYIPEEGITKSGIKKAEALNNIVDNGSYLGKTLVFENRDATKWSLGATLDEFIEFAKGLSSLFTKDNLRIISSFLSSMKLKILEIPREIWKIWDRKYFDVDKLDNYMKILYNISKESKKINLKSNFMMGIFNYLSSAKHVSKMYLVKHIFLEYSYMISIEHFEHSDDEFICYSLNDDVDKNHVINFFDEVVEICGSLTNIKTNYKKSNVNGIIAEFCSSFNVNGQYEEPRINFLTSIFQPTSMKGWSEDMEELSGRIREYIMKCGKVCEITFLINFMNNKLNNLYRLNKFKITEIFKCEQHEIPYHIGGILKVDPVLFLFLGPKSQYVHFSLENISTKKSRDLLKKLKVASKLHGSDDEYMKIKKLMFLHFYKKSASIDTESKYNYLPKSKSGELEYIRLRSLSKNKSFLQSYYKPSYTMNLIQIANFISKDILIDNMNINSDRDKEFEELRNKQGYKKIKTCSIEEFWRSIMDIDINDKINIKTTDFFTTKEVTLSNIIINMVVKPDPYRNMKFLLPKKIKIYNPKLNIKNNLELLGLSYYYPELFKLLNNKDIDYLSLNADKLEVEKLFKKCKDWESFIRKVRDINDTTITLKISYHTDIVSDISEFLQYNTNYFPCKVKYNDELTYKDPVTDEKFDIRNLSAISEKEDMLNYVMNVYTLASVIGESFKTILKNSQLNYQRLKNMDIEDIEDINMTPKELKNLAIIWIREFSSDVFSRKLLKYFSYHEWISTKEDNKILEVYLLDNFCRIKKLDGVTSLELNAKSASILPNLLYYAEETFKGKYLKLEDITNIEMYKSDFVRPNNKNDEIKFTGLYYSTRLKDTLYSLNCQKTKIPKIINVKQECKSHVSGNCLYLNKMSLGKYSHRLKPNISQYIGEGTTINGHPVSDYLSNEFISMQKAENFVNLKFPLRAEWRNLNEEKEEVMNDFVDYVVNNRLAYYFADNMRDMDIDYFLRRKLEDELYEKETEEEKKIRLEKEAEKARKRKEEMQSKISSFDFLSIGVEEIFGHNPDAEEEENNNDTIEDYPVETLFKIGEVEIKSNELLDGNNENLTTSIFDLDDAEEDMSIYNKKNFENFCKKVYIASLEPIVTAGMKYEFLMSKLLDCLVLEGDKELIAMKTYLFFLKKYEQPAWLLVDYPLSREELMIKLGKEVMPNKGMYVRKRFKLKK